MVDAATKFEQGIQCSANVLARRGGPEACPTLTTEGKAAVGNAAYIHKRGVGILKQTFDHDFRFAAIHKLRVDDVVT